MLVIPAIDIKEGKCVRLKEGDMKRDTIFSNNPDEVSSRWFSEGADLLHIVDLDGAIKGKPVNLKIISKIVSQHNSKSIQVGGGIREYENAKAYLESGVERVILGTKAAEDSQLISNLCCDFPNRVVLAIDALNGYVKTKGWTSETKIRPKDLLRRYSHFPLAGVIYTDISRDGMMNGANINATFDLSSNTKHPIIASGGISSLDEIKELLSPPNDLSSIAGVICGRSLYEGVFSLREAIELVEKKSESD